MPNGKDATGRDFTDRELLVRLDERVELMFPRVEALDAALRGDGTERNPGMCAILVEHLNDHKKMRRNMTLLATAVGGAAGVVTDVLHRLGIL